MISVSFLVGVVGVAGVVGGTMEIPYILALGEHLSVSFAQV